MKPKSYTLKVPKTKHGATLLDFLSAELPSNVGITLSKSKVRMLIFAGAVYVNDKRVQKVAFTLDANSEVKAFIDLQRLQKDRSTQQKKLELSGQEIAYEDDDIIVVNKPSGIPTQATVDTSRDHLFAAVQRFLNEREGKEVYLGLHHRLDFDTSGLILFTKRKSANKWVSELFKDRKIQKTYHAISSIGTGTNKRSPKTRWEIKNHIARAKNKTGGRVIHMEAVNSGGDLAHTTFMILKNVSDTQLIECQPHTGRTHQIRIHLQISGQPIVGDMLYGGRSADRILLHAKALSFIHGSTKRPLRIEADYPETFVSVLDRY